MGKNLNRLLAMMFFAAVAAAFGAFGVLSLIFNNLTETACAQTAEELKTVIETYGAEGLTATVEDDTVTVTGTRTGATTTLTLNMNAGVSVIWKAELSGSLTGNNPLVNITSVAGTFTVESGGSVVQTGAGYAISAAAANNTVAINVNGGTIGATSNIAINTAAANSSVTVTGGVVMTTGTGRAISSSGTLIISGGEVFNDGTGTGNYVIYLSGTSSSVAVKGTAEIYIAGTGAGRGIYTDGGKVSVEGGEVRANGGSAIVANSTNSYVSVSGGLVTNSGTSNTTPTIYMSQAAGGVNLSITGGTVKNTGNNGYAVRPYTSGVTFIGGGLVDATGINGTRIYTNGNNIAVERIGYTNSYTAGTGAELEIYPSTAEAVWETVDSKTGIQWANGTNRGFIEIAGVTLSYDGVTGLSVNGGETVYTNVAAAQTAIQAAITAAPAGGTVTVMGTLIDVKNTITLNNLAGKTVEWNAVLSGTTTETSALIDITGTGTNVGSFVLQSGGSVTQYGAGNTYALRTTGNVTVNGGTVQANTGRAITSTTANSVFTVNSGYVFNACTSSGNAAIYLSAATSVLTIKGGEVYTSGAAGAAIYSCGKIYIESGIVTATTGNAIEAYSTATYLEISGGTVQNAGTNGASNANYSAIYMNGSSSAALNFLMTGGTLKNTSGVASACLLYMNGAAFITGGIQDCPNATIPYYMYTGITVEWQQPQAAQYTAGTDTDLQFVSRTNPYSAKWAMSGGKSGIQCVFGSYSVFIEVSGVTVVTDEALYINGGATPFTDVAAAQTAITAALAVNDTVTVTGKLTNVGTTLSITIPAGKTLIWKAEFSGNAASVNSALISITGGTLIIAEGASVKQTGTNRAVYITGTTSNQAKVYVTGGEIISGTGVALYTNNGYSSYIEMTGGLVENAGTNYSNAAVYMNNSSNSALNLLMTGGTVKNTGNGGYLAYAYGAVFVDGGSLEKTGTGADRFHSVSNGSAIIRNAVKTVYVAGMSEDLTVTSANAEVVWAISGGKHGISFRLSASYDGFFEVSGITVTYEGAEGLYVNGGATPLVSGIEAQTAINAALVAAPAGGSVTVTGKLVDVKITLSLDIPTGKTLIWQAEISGNSGSDLLNIDGGTFAVGAGGIITQTGTSRAIYSTGVVRVDGGTVKANAGVAIYVLNNNGEVIVTAGLVENAGVTISNATIYMYVSSSTYYNNPKLTITGGIVRNTSGNANGRVIYTTGVVLILDGEVSNAGTGSRFNLARNAIVIERTGFTNEYEAGTSGELNVGGASSGATAIWNVQGGLPGIAYKMNTNEGFFEISGVVVTVTAVNLEGTAVISNTSGIVDAITNPARYNQSLTGSLAGGNNTGILTYTWYRNGTQIQTGTQAAYTVVAADIGCVVTLVISSDVQTGTVTGDGTGGVKKATQTALTAPSVSSFTHNTVTLGNTTSYEYSKDGVNWQGNVFTSLAPDTEYTFYRRRAETATAEASPASPGTTQKTDLARVTIGGLSAAAGLVYNAQPQAGFVGAISLSITDTGESISSLTLKYTYSGRGGTSYAASPNAPANYGDYTVTISVDDTGYSGSVAINFSIGRRTLTWTQGEVYDKTYDGTTAAAIKTAPGLVGVIEGDTVIITPGTVAFSNSFAGIRTITVSTNYSISGTSASNYIRDNTNPAFANAEIFKIAITWTAGEAYGKVYDGTTNAAVKTQPSYSGVLAGDMAGIVLVAGTISFNSKNADTSAGITAAGYNIGGGAASNYEITGQPAFANAEITKAPLTVTWGNASFTYNGETQRPAANVVETLFGGDTVTLSYNNAGNKDASAAPYSITVLLTGTNYQLTGANLTASYTIGKALLTIKANDKSKVYGTANPAFDGVVSGFAGGDSLANSVSGAFGYTSAATTVSGVNAYTITAGVGTATSNNYAFSFVNGTLTVTKATLAVGAITPTNRSYDGTTAVSYTGGAVSGKIGSDNAGIIITLSVANANAGNNKSVTVLYELTGGDKDNYKLPAVPTNLKVDIAKINPAYTLPASLTAVYGQALADVTLPSGWAWQADGAVGNAGEQTHKATFTPADANNYNEVTDINLTVTVAKAAYGAVSAATVVSKTKNSITINAAEASQGIVEYAIGKTKTLPADEGAWQSGLIFDNLDAGTTYYVFARLRGDGNRFAGEASVTEIATEKETADSNSGGGDNGGGCGSIANGSNSMAGIILLALFLFAICFIPAPHRRRYR